MYVQSGFLRLIFYVDTFHSFLILSHLGADGGVQVDGLRAAVDDLLGGGAVAGGVVGGAVEDLAAVAGGEDVVLVGEGVAPLTAESVSYRMIDRCRGQLG